MRPDKGPSVHPLTTRSESSDDSQENTVAASVGIKGTTSAQFAKRRRSSIDHIYAIRQKHGRKNIPQQIAVDYSWAMIHSVNESFNKITTGAVFRFNIL